MIFVLTSSDPDVTVPVGSFHCDVTDIKGAGRYYKCPKLTFSKFNSTFLNFILAGGSIKQDAVFSLSQLDPNGIDTHTHTVACIVFILVRVVMATSCSYSMKCQGIQTNLHTHTRTHTPRWDVVLMLCAHVGGNMSMGNISVIPDLLLKSCSKKHVDCRVNCKKKKAEAMKEKFRTW